MKKAAYYARVSTSLQEEQGTIESQKNELIQQIRKDGNILIKEYVDEGWSGGVLDRPALSDLRDDLKKDVFEVVYFLDSDRIARNVSYQNIIIDELLKHHKDVIIKGKNYIHNPENKFNLTVIGAVNELEKAKIAERLMRGRREKARRGAIVDSAEPYGYRHILRTDQKYGYLEINDTEAAVVRLIFETYGTTNISLNGLIRLLEEKQIKTARGKSHWFRNTLRYILTNPSYCGDHYFGRTEKVEPTEVKDKNEVKKYLKSPKTKTQMKDKEHWIKIPIPAIISKELFNTVQEKLKRNKQFLRKTDSPHLLSGLIICGDCSHIYSGVTTNTKRYYRCNFRDKQYAHTAEARDLSCGNESVVAKDIEMPVIKILEKAILQPAVIKKYIDILNQHSEKGITVLKDDLARLPKQIENFESKRKRVLDLYTEGIIQKEEYVKKVVEIDKESADLIARNEKIKEVVALTEVKKQLELSLDQYVARAKENYQKATPDERIFMMKTLIKNVVLHKNDTESKVVVKGNLSLGPVEGLSYCNNQFNSVALYHSTTPEYLDFSVVIKFRTVPLPARGWSALGRNYPGTLLLFSASA